MPVHENAGYRLYCNTIELLALNMCSNATVAKDLTYSRHEAGIHDMLSNILFAVFSNYVNCSYVCILYRIRCDLLHVHTT